MRVYMKTMNIISSVIYVVLILFMIILTAVVFGNIALRYIGQSIRWADEVARLIFVWTAFLGMFVGYQRGSHPSFSLFVNKIFNKNPKLGKVFLLVIHLSIIFFLLVIFYGGILYIERAKIQTTAILRLSVGWKYSAGPFTAFLMILESIKKIIFIFTDAEQLVQRDFVEE